jgi:hypothetical protein
MFGLRSGLEVREEEARESVGDLCRLRRGRREGRELHNLELLNSVTEGGSESEEEVSAVEIDLVGSKVLVQLAE